MHKSIRQKQPVREASFLNVKNAGSTAGKAGYREGPMLEFGKLRNKVGPPLRRWNRKSAGQVASLISCVAFAKLRILLLRQMMGSPLGRG